MCDTKAKNMANNRLYLICRKCEDKEDGALAIAKYYPLMHEKDYKPGMLSIGGVDSKDNSGWYNQSGSLSEDINEFFIKHKHNYDFSNFGGNQYDIAYEITGDGINPKEQILNAVSKAVSHKRPFTKRGTRKEEL